MTPPAVPGVRVLIIDDDPLVRRVVARMLGRKGCQVDGADSVREGVRALGAQTYDVVVTDLYMPDEDGFDCLRQLRDKSPETPVIVMSGQLVGEFGDTLRIAIMRLGAVAALPKGADYSELVSLVGQLTAAAAR